MREKVLKLKDHSGAIKYFHNTSWLLFDKVLRLFLGFLVGVWVARYLGPENYGILSFALSLVALLGVVAKLGLDDIVVREVVENPPLTTTIISTSMVIRTIAGAVAFLILVLLVLILDLAFIEKVAVILVGISLFCSSFETFDAFFRAKLKGIYSGIAGMVALLLSSALKVLFILLNGSLFYFAIVVAIEMVVKGIFLFLFFVLTSDKPMSLQDFSWKIGKRLIAESWPLLFSSFSVIVYMRIDQLMIRSMLNVEAVGLYSAAVRVAESWYFVPVTIVNSLFPAMITAKKNSESVSKQRLQYLHDLLFWFGISICVVFSITSEEIVSFLLGSEYIQSAKVLSLYVWVGVLVGLSYVRGRYWIADRSTHVIMVSTLIGMCANVFLNYSFIKTVGFVGAAWATLLSRLLSFFLIPIIYTKYGHLNSMFFRSLLFPLFLFKKLSGGKKSGCN
ncbi:flippase [Spirochaeta thermophila]|uniref:flippase n=1 Tax=Winmispira thermophila TaxID=154 RepID=UPI0002F821CE|nr:flippase [Spirochaeta thermophila]